MGSEYGAAPSEAVACPALLLLFDKRAQVVEGSSPIQRIERNCRHVQADGVLPWFAPAVRSSYRGRPSEGAPRQEPTGAADCNLGDFPRPLRDGPEEAHDLVLVEVRGAQDLEKHGARV